MCVHAFVESFAVFKYMCIQDGYQPVHIAIRFGQLEFYYFLVQKYRIDLNTATSVRSMHYIDEYEYVINLGKLLSHTSGCIPWPF